MARGSATRLGFWTALWGLTLGLGPAWAQTAPGAFQASGVPAGETGAAVEPQPGSTSIRFNFKDAPFDQVVNVFARESGLPVIYEVPVPQSTMTFISAQGYTFEDALTILNLNLAPHGVQLRREQNFLYLGSLKDAARKAGEVFHGMVPGTVRPEQIVNLTIPLSNARAETVAEQIRPLIGEYGSVTAVPAQNMVIVVETAAQCRRIQTIVQAIDAVRPIDSAYRLFPLRHAKADAVFNALKGLVGQRKTTVIYDKDNKPRVLEEIDIAGLNLQPDPRTNSIIAVGPEARIRVVEELIALIDVPDAAGGDAPQVMTFTLEALTPPQAAEQLRALFARLEAAQRPTVIPLPEGNRLAVVGPPALLSQAGALLAEVDPGSSAGTRRAETRRAAIIRLRALAPANVEQFASRLLSPRQQAVLRYGPGPDGRSLIVTGPDADVSAFEQIVTGLDASPDLAREVRQVRITAGEPRAVLERVAALRAAAGHDQTEPVTSSLDEESRTVTLIGPRAAVDRFAELIRATEGTVLGEREARTYDLKHAHPTVVAQRLARMLRPLLMPADGSAWVEPQIEPIDDVRTLIVRAVASQFAVIERLIERLDREDPGSQQLRVMTLSGENPAATVQRARTLYAEQTRDVPSDQGGPVQAELDASSGSVVISGSAEGVRRFTAILTELDRLAGPPRDVRLIELRQAPPRDVKAFLDDLVESSGSLRARGGPPPVIEAIEHVNALLVAATPAQFPIIEALARHLDTRSTAQRQPMRILRLRTTDAANIAAVLQSSFDRRPPDERARRPVEIQADPATNTLIVSAHPEAQGEIESLVEELNRQGAFDAEGREIRIFPLKVAQAEELARTIDQMYSEPPVPLDPRTRQPRPDLQRPREVIVRADRATNSLIVDAPVRRLAHFEQLVRSLDQHRLAGDMELRTYRVQRADVNAAANALRNAAASGALRLPGVMPPGAVAVDVEPVSRSLIISAPAETFAAIEEVLQAVDAPPQRPETGVKLYGLRQARAERIAPLVQRLLVSRVRGEEPGAGMPAGDLVEVSAEPASNTLIVSAPQSVLGVADALIATLDQTSPQGTNELRVFRLRKGEAASVARALSQALMADTPGEPPPTVTPEPASNSIVIVAPQRTIEKAAKLIEQLDASADSAGLGVRTIRLRVARAETIAPVLEGLLRRPTVASLLPAWQLPQYLAGGGRIGDEVRVVADRSANAVVVSGPVAVLDMAEQVAAELDVDRSDRVRQTRPIRVITLAGTDAGELAGTIQAMLGDPVPGQEPATVRVDRASNSLIVRASPEQMEQIEALARGVDAAAVATTRQLRLVPLDRSRADAALVAQAIRRLMEQQGGVRVEVMSAEELLRRESQPGRDAPASDESEKSKRQGAAPGDARSVPGLATLPRASWAWTGRAMIVASWWSLLASAAVGDLPLAGMPGQEGQPETAFMPDAPPDSEPPVVTIAVDPASNSLVVIGPPSLTDRVAALAAQIERQMPPEPTKVRVVGLPAGVDAEAVVPLIRQTVQQVGRAVPGGPGGFTGPVACVADPAGNAIIVWANDTDFAPIAELIRALAAGVATEDLTVKVYPLSGIGASQAMRALADLLSPRPTGRQAQRLRSELAVELQGPDGGTARGRFDPAQVRMTADPTGTAVIVAAPASAMPLIDSFLALLDQSPTAGRIAIRRYMLSHARAGDAAQTLQQLLDAQRQGPGRDALPQARVLADVRGNALLIAGTEIQHADVQRLLPALDTATPDADLRLEFITLRNAAPSVVQRIIEQIVIGGDPGLRGRVLVSAQEGSPLLVVRAPTGQMEQIRALVAEVDRAETAGLPVRFVRLERADAAAVASALQRFFQDRASAGARAGARVGSRVAITGDRRSGTLVVACSDEDFQQVQALVQTFDAPARARELSFRVIPLRHVRAGELRNTIESIASEMQWERLGGYWGRGPREDEGQERLFVEVNERLNSVVLMGEGEPLEAMARVVAELDRPLDQQAQVIARAVPVERGDLRVLADMIRQVTATPGWRDWRGPDPDAVAVQIDASRRLLVLIGPARRVDEAIGYVRELSAAGGEDAVTEAITLKHAQAARAADTLRRVFAERAQMSGQAQVRMSAVGSPDGNVVVLSGDAEGLRTARDLLALIDQPETGKDRRIEVFVVRNREAEEIAGLVRTQFPRSGARPEAQVIVTAQPSTNSLVVSAQAETMPAIEALIAQLDTPPTADTTRVVTVPLRNVQAEEVANALRAALPAGLKVRITPIRRNNTLLVSGSEETVRAVMEQIAAIDVELDRPMMEVKRVRLKHALAEDVAWTIGQMLRGRPRSPGEPTPTVDYSRTDNTLTLAGTPDQLHDMDQMVAALDVPADVPRRTEFVRLEYAKAEATARALEVFYGRWAPEAATPGARAVTIVPDPASNSLVISAAESEWEGLRALLRKLDSEEYDTSRQLAVIPLVYADATSLARALNEGFRAPVESRLRREQARQQREGREWREDERGSEPMVLVDAEPTPTVAAEPQTNSLIVFAGRQEMERIRRLVAQIDVPDFAKLPQVHVLPLETGKASQVAAAVREVYATTPRAGGAPGPRSVVIVGDDTSNALIIRAEEADVAQIRALAEVLQQQGDRARAAVRVIPVRHVPAVRLQRTLASTFSQTARQRNEVLAIEVDRTSNSLVVASTGPLFEEIEKVVRELDGAMEMHGGGVRFGPGAPGSSIFIIDVQNNSPDEVRRQLEQLGVTRPPPDDRQGVVSEPVTIVPLLSRRAIAVVASPADGEAIVALVRALDAAPAEGAQTVAIVGLRLASATALVQTLRDMLNPVDQASQTGPARALAEQVRRLSIVRNALGEGDLSLDLSKPIRLIPDEPSNSVIIASTPENVASLQEVIRTLDGLPLGEAVVVRIFPLSNASALRARSVVEELFRQGEALRRIPGTRRQGLPTTATGRALAGEVATAVDERTNTLIVAGREEAVALIEVIVRDMDSDAASKWIEPAVIPLRYADAGSLAALLRRVLVEGMTATPEAVGLQRQIGRLRMLREGKDLNDPDARIQADLFAPLTGVVVAPEPTLNALIVVASSANLEIVRELVGMLDVEAAGADNAVRIFPLQYAAADRVAALVLDIFRQREQLPQARPEDRMILTADIRTNSLVASTSARNFSILEAMLRTLDREDARATVGIHVVPVFNASAAALAPRIERLMRERLTAAQRTGDVRSPLDAFAIEADAANNLLIVACSDENLRLVRELVDTLSQGNAAMLESARMELIVVRAGRAAETAATVREAYADKENARRGPGSVLVVPNERLNALVVAGTEADVAAIRRLIERLEAADVVSAQDIRRIGLRAANAHEVVTLLQNVLAGRAVSGGADIAARQATRIRFFREQVARALENRTGETPTEAQIDGAIREQVTLTADLRTNSVLVKAPAEVMEVIRQIVDDLDTTSAGARRVEMFTLRNADARSMATLLRDVFTLQQQGTRYVLVPAPPTPGQETPDAQTLTPVPDERQELAVAIDARTNTLIVSGTEEYLKRVRQIVEELDAIEATERVQQVYALRNARAKDVETTLQAYFRGEAAIERTVLGPEQIGARIRLLEQEVTVVGDEKSNKLVISTSPRYMDTVLAMVRELDSAPPQVVIQVLLAEVTLDSAETWGADLRVKNIGGENFTAASLAAGAGVASALGVPNLTFASADFELLLRALEAQGKLQVLSRPYVTARNNEPASIQVGDNIAIVRDVLTFPQGNTQANVERRDIGIILDVTPSISPDGFVRMELQPEISSLSSRTTQISPEFQAPVITQRKVKTTVTVKDGQTVVIGGLIQTEQQERQTKVPLLGDIPVLGSLFRSSTASDIRTELLVILTPRVIYNDTPEGLERFQQISEHKIGQMADPRAIREAIRRDGVEADAGMTDTPTAAPADGQPSAGESPAPQPDVPTPSHARPPQER